MRYFAPIIAVLCVFFISGCNIVTMCDSSTRGSGVEKTEQRTVGNFTSIDVSGACDVQVTCGGSTSVQVSGDDNIVPLITTKVEGGTLYISHEGSINPKTKLVITIATPNLDAVTSSGASDIKVEKINNSAFAVDVSGAGSVEAVGNTGTLSIDISGATDVITKELHAKKVKIGVSGASNAEVFATEELSADVSGVGNITYYGNPSVINQNVSGVGSITKK